MAKRKQKKSFNQAIKEAKTQATIKKIALDWAIAVIGTPTELARTLGETKQGVHGWQQAGAVPFRKAPAVERQTGVSRFVLQTDIPAPPGDDWKKELEEIRADIVEQRCADASALWGE